MARRTKRKTQFRTTYLVGIAVVVAVLVGVNVLGKIRFKRFDLTQSGELTVSPAMRQILGDLRDVVKVTYYVSKELPEELRDVRRDTLDRFQELERAAGGNFQYRIVDVPEEIFDEAKRESDSRLKRLDEELRAEQIPPVSAHARRAAGAEERLIYSTIAVAYLDKPKEYVHPYWHPQQLEYELALILVRLAQEEKPVVAFYDGKPTFREVPSPSPMMPAQREHEFSELVTALGEFFDVREIRLTEESPIPGDTQCLIVAQPSNMNERQKYEIARYISGGGDAVFFVSEHTVQTAGGRMPFPVVPNSPNLNDLFGTWGFTIGPALVADKGTGQTIRMLQQTPRGLAVREQRMPMFLLLTGENLDQDSPLTTRLTGLYFKNATPIVLDEKRLERNGIEAQALAETSEQSWFLPVAGAPFLSPFLFREPETDDGFEGPQKLAVVFRGTFPFKYADQPVPEWPKPEVPEDGGADDVEPGEVVQPLAVTEPSAGVESELADEKGGVAEVDESEATVSEAEGAVTPETVAPPLTLKPATVLVVSTVEPIKFGSEDMRGNDVLIRNHLTFFFNAVETFALGHDLVSIRAKTLSARPFEESADVKVKLFGHVLFSMRRMTVYNLINLLVVPLVVVVLGVLRYAARRRSRRVYREKGLS